jgi:beta-N-acetylhexosaminidase
MSASIPLIFGTSGPVLLDEEARLFEESQPAGFILFARNCVDPQQLKKLNRDLKAVVPNAHILIDQEGGRVMRMKPPVWPSIPAPKLYGEMYDRSPIMACESLKKDTGETAKLLTEHGFTVNCAPLCDLFVPGAHAVIGDRAFHASPEVVSVLAEAQARAFIENGIQPVIKHMPGHGRANMDSHTDMPVIDCDLVTFMDDLQPFRALATGQLGNQIWGMVAHCVYPQLDESARPASASRTLIQNVIRDQIGLEGLLLTDDICMAALSVIGGPAARTEACLEAGCDLVLHCNGKIDEMREIIAAF